MIVRGARAAAVSLAIVVAARAVSGAAAPAGSLVKRTYVSSIDGASIDYALWVPNAYDAKRSWPLIVFLHGSGESESWSAPTAPGAGVPVRGARSDIGFLVAFPLMRGCVTISGMAEKDVLDTIADVQAHYSVDADRIHLTGLSFGGFAAWQIACHHPHLFASLSVFCGGGQPELAVNLRHVPTQVWHGADDVNVPIAHSLDMVEAMRRARLTPIFHELRGTGHVCWREPYADAALYRWMADQRRVRAPNRISYRTFGLRHAQAYWATILEMADPSLPAYVDIFAPVPGQVLVHAENVTRLLLDPPADLLPPSGKPVFRLEGKPLRVVETPDGWLLVLPGAAEGPWTKRPGLSGPIQDIYCDSFRIVLPTGGQDEAYRAGWEMVAASAFHWTSALVYSGIEFISDTDVSLDFEARFHLVCFGDADSNRVLARVQGRLPLLWKNGLVVMGDHVMGNFDALVMICPNPRAPNRYLLVCSGRPKAVAQAAALALRPPMLSPPPLEDVILMTPSGGFLTRARPETQPERPARMNAVIPPRGLLFDSAWQLGLQHVPAPLMTRPAPTPADGPNDR